MDNSATHSDTLILCLVASCERFLCFYFLCALLTHLKRLVPEEKVTNFFLLAGVDSTVDWGSQKNANTTQCGHMALDD